MTVMKCTLISITVFLCACFNTCDSASVQNATATNDANLAKEFKDRIEVPVVAVVIQDQKSETDASTTAGPPSANTETTISSTTTSDGTTTSTTTTPTTTPPPVDTPIKKYVCQQ